MYFNSFMTEAVIISLNWFLYDHGLRHERVNPWLVSFSITTIKPFKFSQRSLLLVCYPSELVEKMEL